MTRAQLAQVMRARAEAIAGEPCTLGCVTPDLWTYRTPSGCTVHVWREGDAILLPPWLRRPAPHAPRSRTTPGAA